MASTAVKHGGPYSASELSEQARRHLWMHFTRIGSDVQQRFTVMNGN